MIRVPPTDQAVRLLERFKTRAEFVKAIETRLAVSGTARPLGWERAFEALRATRGRANKKILEKLDRVMSALQDPKRYAEVLGDAWAMVKGGSAADINEALIAMASSGRLRITSIGAIQPGGQFFEQVVSRKEYWIDHALSNKPHGEMSHLLQDLIVDRALGGPGKSAESAASCWPRPRAGSSATCRAGSASRPAGSPTTMASRSRTPCSWRARSR